MSEILLEILKKLPLDALIYLCFTVIVLAGIVLIPFWVKRVEGRMADVHRMASKMTSDGLRMERFEKRLGRLEDIREEHDDKFRDIDIVLTRIETTLATVVIQQERILDKLSIV